MSLRNVPREVRSKCRAANQVLAERHTCNTLPARARTIHQTPPSAPGAGWDRKRARASNHSSCMLGIPFVSHHTCLRSQVPNRSFSCFASFFRFALRCYATTSPDLVFVCSYFSTSTESIETLVRVADEGQAQGRLLLAHLSFRLRAQGGRVVDLRDLVDREVLSVDIALEFGLKWSTDAAKLIPVDAVEEWVILELGGARDTTQTVLRVADEAGNPVSVMNAERYNSLTHLRMKCSASGPSCWSGGKLRWRGQSTILR